MDLNRAPCVFEDCHDVNHGHGMCRKHYREHFKEQDKESQKQWRKKNEKKVKKDKKKYAKENSKRLREKSSRWYYANKEKVRKRDSSPEAKYGTLRSTAKRRGIEFKIDFPFYRFLSRLPCFYCMGPLPVFGHGIDRKNNKLGYIQENCIPCCQNCNLIKRNLLSLKEMQAAIRAVYEVRGSQLGKLWQKE